MNKDKQFLRFFELSDNQNILSFFSTEKQTIIDNLENERMVQNLTEDEFCEKYLINSYKLTNRVSYAYLFSLNNKVFGESSSFLLSIKEYQPTIYNTMSNIFYAMSKDIILALHKAKNSSNLEEYELSQLINEDLNIFYALTFGRRDYPKDRFKEDTEIIKIDVDDYLRVLEKLIEVIG